MKTQNQTGFTQMAQTKKPTFSMAITAPNTQQMISRALKNDKMAARFTSTLIGAVSASEALKACDPGTIIAAGLRGEGMGLIYGHGYYIVPYGSVATYLMSYKGYIQLAMSTGYYADIDCVEVREGELEGRSRRTGKPVINLAKYDTDEERESHKIIGYYAYFELKDGTFRYEYWSMDKLLKHADRYSPAFKLDKYNALVKGELDAKEQAKLLNGTPWYDVNGGQGQDVPQDHDAPAAEQRLCTAEQRGTQLLQRGQRRHRDRRGGRGGDRAGHPHHRARGGGRYPHRRTGDPLRQPHSTP